MMEGTRGSLSAGPLRSGSQPSFERLRAQEAAGKERSEGVWKIGAGHLERRRTGGGRKRRKEGGWVWEQQKMEDKELDCRKEVGRWLD